MTPSEYCCLMFIFEVRDNVQESVTQLEKLLPVLHDVKMPSVKSFKILNERTDTVQHDWSHGTTITADHIRCQVCPYIFVPTQLKLCCTL